MDIRSGPAEVVAAGQAMTFREQPLEVGFDVGGRPFRLTFSFFDGDEAAVAMEPTAEGVHFRCVALEGRQGRGSAEPVLVGEHGGHGLYVHFRVFRWGESADRSVQWTVYRVAEPLFRAADRPVD